MIRKRVYCVYNCVKDETLMFFEKEDAENERDRLFFAFGEEKVMMYSETVYLAAKD